ncbi:hypothetical protein BurJ1DRAFT_0638 [Burkholderiales bacterium JOSHI_001]|nr:hypothetical protein BurJ1DRAFT_0638 [Burkholderiales bacterium JOSHI_001]
MVGSARVVVRSVGAANPSAALVLAQALPLSREHVARCVYQAPAVLMGGLPEQQAQALCQLLQKTGLDVGVDNGDAPLATGGPDYEVAVHVSDASRFREVAAAVAAFVGCAPSRAVDMLCGSPAVVLGQVSLNTVQALAERLAPLDAQLDASRVADARYDLFVDDGQPDLRQRLRRELTEFDIECQAQGPLLASALDRACAQALWQRHSGQGGWRLLDQAMQRFDLWLEAPAVEAPAVAAVLACTGMPAGLLPQVNAGLPFLLAECLPGVQARDALLALHDAGVRASAKLVTLSRWDLTLQSAADARAAAHVLARVGGLEAAQAAQALLRLPQRLAAGLTLPRARWLQAELAAVGCPSELEPR